LHDGRINTIWIKTIESIDLATPINPEAFVVSVAAGTAIFDYRDGSDDTDRGVVRSPVTDIIARANEIAATRKRFVPPVKPGDQAPAIEEVVWLNQSGKIDAPKLKNKVVLVDFWGITCGPCVAELPEVREAAEHFTGTDLSIIGLHDSSGTVEQVAEFAAKRGISYPLAIDRASNESGWFGATFAAYGVRGIPSAAVLDRQGKVVFVGQFREAIEKAAALLK
jgi:peroxiredoxin